MFCECGCGKVTTLATRTDRNIGVYKGEYRKFVRGHKKVRHPITDGTKICSACLIEKPISAYYAEKENPTGLRTECKECKDQKRKMLVLEHQIYRDDVKRQHGCLFCGEQEPVALDFHHVDPTQKQMKLSQAFHALRRIEDIQAEIDKCVILCANCHRKLHAGILTLDIAKNMSKK